MVVVRKKVVGKQTYYYLEHAFRQKSRVRKRQLYLGKRIPEDIEDIKRNFLSEIYKEKWLDSLDRIKKNFAKELRKRPKSAKEKEMEAFAVRFTYDTQRIEGSTLSLRETANLLENSIAPKAKPMKDVKEAESHRQVFYEMLQQKKDLSLLAILQWHRNLFLGTKPDMAGQVRKHQVTITGSRFIPPFPAEIFPMLREFFGWYEKNKGKMHPVELAAMVHLKFVTIHPFTDGNGRISRLMMNFVLRRHGYPMLNIPYEGRNSYYNALEKSQTKKLDSIFVQWVIKRYMKDYEQYSKI